jgi:hypothetical protein
VVSLRYNPIEVFVNTNQGVSLTNTTPTTPGQIRIAKIIPPLTLNAGTEETSTPKRDNNVNKIENIEISLSKNSTPSQKPDNRVVIPKFNNLPFRNGKRKKSTIDI